MRSVVADWKMRFGLNVSSDFDTRARLHQETRGKSRHEAEAVTGREAMVSP